MKPTIDKLKRFDWGMWEDDSWIRDEKTKKKIGVYQKDKGICSVSLFGKCRGEFDRYDECVAFAMGVAAVLNHIVEVPEEYNQ